MINNTDHCSGNHTTERGASARVPSRFKNEWRRHFPVTEWHPAVWPLGRLLSQTTTLKRIPSRFDACDRKQPGFKPHSGLLDTCDQKRPDLKRMSAAPDVQLRQLAPLDRRIALLPDPAPAGGRRLRGLRQAPFGLPPSRGILGKELPDRIDDLCAKLVYRLVRPEKDRRPIPNTHPRASRDWPVASSRHRRVRAEDPHRDNRHLTVDGQLGGAQPKRTDKSVIGPCPFREDHHAPALNQQLGRRTAQSTVALFDRKGPDRKRPDRKGPDRKGIEGNSGCTGPHPAVEEVITRDPDGSTASTFGRQGRHQHGGVQM